MGPTERHGPHQGAQKSTRTGSADPSTSLSKVASVTFTGRLKISFGKTAPHFPHFGVSLILDTGTLFFAEHFLHTNIKLSAMIIIP
jgi:hypothetical protein